MAERHYEASSSSQLQFTDMMNELSGDGNGDGNNDEPFGHHQTGRFIPMVNTTTISLPNSVVSSPAMSSNRRRRVAIDEHQHTTFREKYRPRTMGPHNMKRMAILPLFPTTNVNVEKISTSPSISIPAKIAHPLLCNVPIDSLGHEQYARLRPGIHPLLFKLETNPNTTYPNDSFLLTFHKQIYGELKQRLRVDISILDFNLTRLRLCVDQVVEHYHLKQTMLNLDELACALEFYLQIDVDLFYLKTCSFNGVKPRIFNQRQYEGLFCLSTPTARFALEPCGQTSCHCCHPPCPRQNTTTTTTTITIPAAIQFSLPRAHRFLNQYEAILNCPATCQSQNCIYVLTCPCGRADFIGESKVSFAETMTLHREEGNRIIREFLMGEQNINLLTQGLKSEKKKQNDQSRLYQHSTRCSIALRLFLDYYPEYWCFVPTKTVEQTSNQGQIVRGYLSRQSTASLRGLPSLHDVNLLTTWNRKDTDVRILMDNLPEPPVGYSFTSYQRQQQANFFKWTQDRNVPLYHVDLYDANIIAILPDNASKLFRKLIESLLITHAECKLNQTGHLLGTTNINPNYTHENVWCANLTPPSNT